MPLSSTLNVWAENGTNAAKVVAVVAAKADRTTAAE